VSPNDLRSPVAVRAGLSVVVIMTTPSRRRSLPIGGS
jgi:hypothetical protein